MTYKTAIRVREVAKKMPLERLLVETDSPYLKPANATSAGRESRDNNPAMGLWIAAEIAKIKNVELDEVLIQVRKNISNMYGI